MTANDNIYYLIKLLLYTAKEDNADVTATKIQKIFFLLEKEKGIDLGLEFRPWILGVYSSKLQDYVDKLIELGEIGVEEEEVKDPISGEVIAYKRRYVLTSPLAPEVKGLPLDEVKQFFKEWVRKSRDEILRYVYEKYPEYNKFKISLG